MKEPEHEVLTISAGDSDDIATRKVQGVIRKLTEGKYGKKVLVRIEQPAD